MKKLYYLIAMALMGLTFTSCEDVPAPFGQPVKPEVVDDDSGETSSEIAKIDFKAAGKIIWTVTKVSGPDDVWTYDSKYGMKATAYTGGANNEAESWLISPDEYDLSGVTGTTIKIHHAANYFNSGAEAECFVMVSSDYKSGAPSTGTWTSIKIDKWPDSWTFVDGKGNMSAFDGKKVRVALKYTSTASKSGTWEVESLEITGGGESGGDTPAPTGEYGTKENPLTVAKALEVINGLADNGTVKPAYVKGKISNVQKYDADHKSITYYISDDGTDNNALQVYSGKDIDGADFAAATDLEKGWTVIVTGELKKYVKNDNVTPEINQSSQIVSIDKTTGGGGGDTNTGLPYTSVNLNTGWTLKAVSTDQPWIPGSSYVQATGYQKWDGAESKSNRAVEGWLVSPAFSTKGYENVKIWFDQTIKYTNNYTGWEANHKVYVSSNYDESNFSATTWVEITDFIPKASEYSDWTLYSSGELQLPASMVGKEAIHIAFYFKAPENGSTTWELKNFNIAEGIANNTGGGDTGGGDTGGNTITAAFSDLDCSNVANIILSDGTTISITQESGKTTPIYHESSKMIRMYAQNAMTINAGSKKIAKVEFTFDGTYKGNDAMYGEAGSNKITPTKENSIATFANVNNSILKVVNDFESNSGGTQFRTSKITITYAE